jgi:muramoyltetrapeptide carboxypeptidase
VLEPYRPVPRGGTIGVFAPSSPFPEDRFAAGLAILEGLGYRVHVHPQARSRTGYLAGTDRARAAAFRDLLDDPSIDAVMAARGGYGAHRWLEEAAFDRAREVRKPVVGFSDMTAIHAGIGCAGLRSIHGPVVTQLGDLPRADDAHLVDLLSSSGPIVLEGEEAIASGRAEGMLVGGNLSVLVPLVGTRFEHIPDGSILLIEDVQEAPYRIDRMLTHLRLAGRFARVAGVAVGEMVGCLAPREGEPTVEEVLRDRLGDLGVPVVRGLPFGHGRKNLGLPLGSRAILDAGKKELRVDA